MAFPSRLLNEGEEIAFDLRPHWWYFAKPGFAGVMVIALLYGVLKLSGDVEKVALWIFAVAAGVWGLWVIWKLLTWVNTNFVVTSHRLIFRSGVLGKHGREIPLERVNDIAFHQSLWERIIGAGDLLIESAGEQGQQRFTDIPEPESMQQEIYKQIEAYKARNLAAQGAAMAPAVAAAPSVPEQISQLADLRDRGVLSDVEFEDKKRALLEKM